MTNVGLLPGIPANVLRRLLFGSISGFFVSLALASVAAWLSFDVTGASYNSARAVFVIAIVGGMFSAVALTIFRIAYPRRLEREVIHRTIQSGGLDIQQMPSMLIGRPVEESEMVKIDSDGVKTTVPSRAQAARPLAMLAMLAGLGLVILGSGAFLVRVLSSLAVGDNPGAALIVLAASTLLAVFIPCFVLWALGARRNRYIRRAIPNSLLTGSIRTPPLEFGLAQIDPSTIDQVRYFLAWSFDATGATLWQGAPTPRKVATIARDQIRAVGFQSGAEVLSGNSRVYDRIVIVATAHDGREIMVPFLVRSMSSPWKLSNGKNLELLRSRIVEALRPTPANGA